LVRRFLFHWLRNEENTRMHSFVTDCPRLTIHRLRKFLFLIAPFAIAFALAAPVQAGSSTIVVSQVYGGGGNSGATYKNDFIELYNLGGSTVNVSGWSVQYAATGGTSWQRTNLVGSIAPGHYYLIQEAAGSGGTVSLPTPDATGSIP